MYMYRCRVYTYNNNPWLSNKVLKLKKPPNTLQPKHLGINLNKACQKIQIRHTSTYKATCKGLKTPSDNRQIFKSFNVNLKWQEWKMKTTHN